MNFATITLGFLLAWLPFSVGLLTFSIGIVTFTIYIMGLLFLIPFCCFNLYIKGKKYDFNNFDLIIVIFCFAFLISTFFSSQIIESGYLAFHSIFIPVLSYFIIKSLVTDEKKYFKAYHLMIIGYVIFCVFTILLFVQVGMKSRVFVFSRDSIAIATFSVLGLSYLVYSKRWKGIIGIIGTLLCLGALIASLSRGYLVIILLSPLFYLLIRRGKSFLLIMVFLIATLFGTLVLSIYPKIVEPTGKYQTKYENTLERITNINYWGKGLYGRVLYFQESLKAFAESPVFGIGLKPLGAWKSSTVHNFHIEWLLYGGVVGYLLFFISFLFHFHNAQEFAKQDIYCATNLMIILIILSNSLANGLMHGVMPYVMFIMIGFNEARIRILRNVKKIVAKQQPLPSSMDVRCNL